MEQRRNGGAAERRSKEGLLSYRSADMTLGFSLSIGFKWADLCLVLRDPGHFFSLSANHAHSK